MNEVDNFSFGLPPSFGAMRECRRHLLLAGKSVGVVWGDKLQRQFQCSEGFILVTSYDYFEGTNHWFYLLDPNGHPLDRVSTPDYFGFIERVKIESLSSLSFGFFGTHDHWSLVVRGNGNGNSVGSAVRRLSGFVLGSRRLILSCSKGGPWALSV